MDSFNIMADSIFNESYRGSWYSTQTGYEFADISFRNINIRNHIKATINVQENTIEFIYTKM